MVLGFLAFAALSIVHTPVAPFPSPRQMQSRPSFIRGLQASEVADGRLRYSLRIGAARFEAGMLGVFRVGFVPALALDDVQLTVYVDPAGADTGSLASSIESAFVKLFDQHNPSRLGWLSGSPVTASPFRLRVVQGQQELAALTAERGSVDIKRREIHLEGASSLATDGGLRRLEGQRLRVTLDPDRVWAEGPARLVTPEGTREGQGVLGDLFLRNVSIRSDGSGQVGTATAHEAEQPEKE